MWVKLARPQWSRSCDDCRKFIYEDSGKQKIHRRTGLPVINLGGMTPCSICPKIPDRVFGDDGKEIAKTPGNAAKLRPHAVELTPRLTLAWQHYRECRAVGSFPDDPLVRGNAVRFRHAQDESDVQRQVDRDDAMMELVTLALTKGRR